MKNFAKLLIFSLIAMILLGGCSSDTTTIQPAKLLTGYGQYMDYCLINVNENGTVEYISFDDVSYANFREEISKKDIKQKRTIRLSQKNKIIVDELIQKVIANEPDIEEIFATGGTRIRALIDGKDYLSLYYEMPAWYGYNEDLANLAYKLVELAPFKVGGRYNPLKVPDRN